MYNRQFSGFTLLITCLLACKLVVAKSPTCPSARDLLTADTRAGQFVPSMWKLVDAKSQVTDLSDPVLIFAAENGTNDGLRLEGYFWWRRDGLVIACSHFEGLFDSTSGEVELRNKKASSNVVPPLSWFKARLAEDRQQMLDFKIIWSETGANNTSRWLNQGYGGTRAGPWTLLKVFPSAE